MHVDIVFYMYICNAVYVMGSGGFCYVYVWDPKFYILNMLVSSDDKL